MRDKLLNDGGPAFPESGPRGIAVGGEGMSLRDAMAMSVRLPDDYSAKWGEALIGEQHPSEVEPVSVHIDWWMRVEAVYRYRMADAMLKAREMSND